MRRCLAGLAVALAVLLFAIAIGELTLKSFPARRLIGRLFHRGELLALVHGEGIYDSDLDRMIGENVDENFEPTTMQKRAALRQLVLNAALRNVSANQPVSGGQIEEEVKLLRDQFGSEQAFTEALQDSGLTRGELRRAVSDNLRARSWLEAKIAMKLGVTEEECRNYFAAHAGEFGAPLRLRASHIFAAAPTGYPPEILATKRKLIESMVARLKREDSFTELVRQFSEDENTKKRDGDLGYFSESRMTPEFFAAAAALRVGETSGVVQSHLGFHILRLTDAKPPQQLPFAAVRDEIAASIRNKKRRVALRSAEADLGR